TDAALREGASRRPGVLCLATHAEALPLDPMASFVALASGKLTADVVHGLDLPVPLVVLAACETGGGQVTGDGVIGLSRAFLSAGPVAVLMTLWPVVERDSLRLLRRFHDVHLNTSLGTAQALRAAQCSMVAGAASPQSWAAFTLFGLPQ
ncbi:MAG TPA: CHAT domain-containing protein, partial [Trebonia sp.]